MARFLNPSKKPHQLVVLFSLLNILWVKMSHYWYGLFEDVVNFKWDLMEIH